MWCEVGKAYNPENIYVNNPENNFWYDTRVGKTIDVKKPARGGFSKYENSLSGRAALALPFVFGFGICGSLPLHVVWCIVAPTCQRFYVVNYVAWAGALYPSCCWARVSALKRYLCLLAAPVFGFSWIADHCHHQQ
jgi:hypothetical protein